VLDFYISSLEDMEHLSCDDGFIHRQTDSLSEQMFPGETHKKFWTIKGQSVAPRQAKHAVSGCSTYIYTYIYIYIYICNISSLDRSIQAEGDH